MILTDKALEDFNKWNYDDDFGYIDHEPTSLVVHFEYLDEFLQNTIIIEYLDSVGIYVDVGVNQITDKNTNKSNCNFDVAIFHPHHRIEEGRTLTQLNINVSRQEAIKQAILKCNIIYNESLQTRR